MAQVETQGFGKLVNDPDFKAAADQITGDGVEELSKANAKLITHERSILMPSVKALTENLNAMFIDQRGCNKQAFETCLTARPVYLINPFIAPPDW
jgi:DNA phosphorothioation-dependent restriction protein DptG